MTKKELIELKVLDKVENKKSGRWFQVMSLPDKEMEMDYYVIMIPDIDMKVIKASKLQKEYNRV